MHIQYIIDDRKTGETLFSSNNENEAIAYALEQSNIREYGNNVDDYMKIDDENVQYFIREHFYVDTMISRRIEM